MRLEPRFEHIYIDIFLNQHCSPSTLLMPRVRRAPGREAAAPQVFSAVLTRQDPRLHRLRPGTTVWPHQAGVPQGGLQM